MGVTISVIVFHHNGQTILDPYKDENGVGDVTPEYYGFEQVKKDGLEYLSKALLDGSSIRITDHTWGQLPEKSEDAYIAGYSADGCQQLSQSLAFIRPYLRYYDPQRGLVVLPTKVRVRK